MTSQYVSPVSPRLIPYLSWAKMIRTGVGLGACITLLSGCQHRAPTTLTADWVHSLEGGEIYRLRPPTPGYDQPYPRVGRTPTTTPDFPSPEARAALTQKLEAQRNTAQRLSAASGPLPSTNASNPLPPAPGNGNSMTMVSHQQGPTTSSSASPHATPSPSSTHSSSQLTYQAIDHRVPHTLPAVSNAPPPPITFPGFQIPATAMPLTPDFDATTPAGTLLRFSPDSDHVQDGQDNILASLSANRHNNYILIRGFGTALSPSSGLSPDDQQHGIRLGLLRAQAVAQKFISYGVPANMIELRADPIGDGVRVLYRLR